jgi:hypothetical protein
LHCWPGIAFASPVACSACSNFGAARRGVAWSIVILDEDSGRAFSSYVVH